LRAPGRLGLALLVVCAGAAAVAGVALSAGAQDSGIRRTVYVTAFDAAGAPLADLSAADVAVKEGGNDADVVRVEPLRSRLKVALVVEETLTPDNLVRQALAGFVDGVHEAGEIALYVVGRRHERRVDYTSDIMPFVRAINAFPARSTADGNLVEALYEIAKDQRPLEGRRVVVALATEKSQAGTLSADGVFEQLRAGNGVFYAATLASFDSNTGPSEATSGGRRLSLENQATGLERDRLFTTGTRDSGGLHLSLIRLEGFPGALNRIVGDLRNQYVVSYTTAAGQKPDGRVSITARRKGITVRGPSRVAAN
jgi:hypothetical protein